MKNIPIKTDNIDSLSADEFNPNQNELENSVTTTGQTLVESNEFQLSEAMARYASTGGVFYQDSGAADAYFLGALGSFVVPAVYLNGMEAVFKTTNPSTGASTINIGGIGVKSFTLPDGTPISTEITANEYHSVRFNEGEDRVELVNVSQSGGGAASILARGYIDGLIMSNNTTDADHDLDIDVGVARDDADTNDISLASGLTKRLDASWSVGNDQGGLDTGFLAADTSYHVFVIKRTDTGTVDIIFSTTVGGPVLPTNYDKFRRIGSIITDASSNIRGFLQTVDTFEFNPRIQVFDGSLTGSTTVTLPTPLGIITTVTINCHADVSGSEAGINLENIVIPTFIGVGSNATDVFGSFGASSKSVGRITGTQTNLLSQIRLIEALNTVNNVGLVIYNYVDLRGQN